MADKEKTTRVCISIDEDLPVYICNRDFTWCANVYEIPDELLERWEKVRRDFIAIMRVFNKICGKELTGRDDHWDDFDDDD